MVNVALVGLIIAAMAFVVFTGIILYLTGKVNGNPTGESNEWLGVADNEGD